MRNGGIGEGCKCNLEHTLLRQVSVGGNARNFACCALLNSDFWCSLSHQMIELVHLSSAWSTVEPYSPFGTPYAGIYIGHLECTGDAIFGHLWKRCCWMISPLWINNCTCIDWALTLSFLVLFVSIKSVLLQVVHFTEVHLSVLCLNSNTVLFWGRLENPAGCKQ